MDLGLDSNNFISVASQITLILILQYAGECCHCHDGLFEAEESLKSEKTKDENKEQVLLRTGFGIRN